MKRVPVARAPQELRWIFGELADDPGVVSALERVDAGLREFAAALDFRTEGLTVAEYPGPPCKRGLSGYVEGSGLEFWIELAAGEFYEGLGRSPDRYYAEAELLVEPTSRFGGQETAVSLPVVEAHGVSEAIQGLAGVLAELRRRAAERPATARAWRVHAAFGEIELRERAASGVGWEPGPGASIAVTEADGQVWRLRVTREREPADPADVEFIGHARSDVAALLSHMDGTGRLSPGELARIARRVAGAGAAPWRAFLESDGGVGGCSVIVVSDADDEPDLYLWRGDELAPDGDFEFVAGARQDIPRLLEAARA